MSEFYNYLPTRMSQELRDEERRRHIALCIPELIKRAEVYAYTSHVEEDRNRIVEGMAWGD